MCSRNFATEISIRLKGQAHSEWAVVSEIPKLFLFGPSNSWIPYQAWCWAAYPKLRVWKPGDRNQLRVGIDDKTNNLWWSVVVQKLVWWLQRPATWGKWFCLNIGFCKKWFIKSFSPKDICGTSPIFGPKPICLEESAGAEDHLRYQVPLLKKLIPHVGRNKKPPLVVHQ